MRQQQQLQQLLQQLACVLVMLTSCDVWFVSEFGARITASCTRCHPPPRAHACTTPFATTLH